MPTSMPDGGVTSRLESMETFSAGRLAAPGAARTTILADEVRRQRGGVRCASACNTWRRCALRPVGSQTHCSTQADRQTGTSGNRPMFLDSAGTIKLWVLRCRTGALVTRAFGGMRRAQIPTVVLLGTFESKGIEGGLYIGGTSESA